MSIALTSTKELISDGTSFVKSNLGTIGAGIGGLAIGGALGAGTALAVTRSKRKKRRSGKRGSRKRRNKSHKGARRSRRTPRTAGKGRDRSTKRIRYTKKGQPYIIMANGKPRFIKKSSAKQSHKRPGGRY